MVIKRSVFFCYTILMAKILIGIIVVIVVLVGGFFWLNNYIYQEKQGDGGGEETSVPTYTSEKYGISFTYPSTYQLSEREAPGSALREHHTITLMRTVDLPAPEGGEGPPAISIDIYQNNLDKQTTEGWIRGSSNSNFKLSPEGRLASTTIDGKPALSYRWSGLYEGTTIALAQPDWIYAFTVTYLEPGADIVQDFVTVRDSVRIR